jgi:hypothetical protein
VVGSVGICADCSTGSHGSTACAELKSKSPRVQLFIWTFEYSDTLHI